VAPSRHAARGSRARCRVGTQPTRHGRARAARRCAARVARAGRGGGVAREPLFGLPGLRVHLLVGRAVAFVGGLVPGISEVVARVGAAWASSRAAARRASPAWAACNAAPARPARASAARSLASSTARPAIRSRRVSWTTSWARSATLARLFRFLALAVVGEASKPSAAMAAVAHPCSREEQP